ncbi:MAG: efflux RND transporter periplasmic adaptor subunit [Verrucomicrobia subdivision 3 bacterium]|nr:efflux RND transporter periplasmic adaptor subunit [Limisphaerales bacterium]
MKRFAFVFSLGCLTICAGCRDSRRSENDGHEHEEKTAQITVWTDRYEIFAEHTAPVVNKPTRFITHVTDLKTAEPRTEGMVKFVLRQGETTFEHPQAEPQRPGIYIPAITFPKTGDWQAALLVPTNGSNAVVEMGAIKVYPDDHSAAHAEFPEAPEGISFLKEQQWKILTRTEAVTRHKLVERVPVPAEVRAKPGFSATVAAPLAGHLAGSGDSSLTPGTRVKAGETLALLKPRFSDAAARFVEIEAEFGRAEAVLKQAGREFERTKKLAAQQARTERELQEAEVALATAKAQYGAAASLRSTYAANSSDIAPGELGIAALQLRAPITGVLTKVNAGIGEPVAADQVVFTLLNPERVWLEARVPEADATRLSKAQNALLELPSAEGRFFSVGAEDGRLVFAGLEVDAATRTIPLIFELSNANTRMRIGQAVRLHVETARAEKTIAIPESAIVEEGGQPVAFVQVSGETFEKRELTLGIRDGTWVQVLRGVAEGERVVTRGAMAIRLAAASNVIPAHGHAH